MKKFLVLMIALFGSTMTASAEERVSTMQSFAAGDIFVGATVLNNPEDDHAGIGRIIQYDENLNEKGVLWTEGTTHLITGVTFAPDGTLWAFDPWKRSTINVDTSGKQIPAQNYAERAFSKAHFIDGNILLTEQLVGTGQPLGLSTRFRPLPGETEKIGDGDLYLFQPDGTLLKTMDPDTHGGMSGGMGVTHSALSADQSTLFYVSETGPRLMAYDLANDQQLPDLKAYPENTGNMVFDLDMTMDDKVLIAMGGRLDVFDHNGNEIVSYPLEGFGWSIVATIHDGEHVIVGNWFSGEIIKYHMKSGEIVARTKVGEKTIAGIAEYWPQQ